MNRELMTINADEADAVAGRINGLIHEFVGGDRNQIVPGARLSRDLGLTDLDLLELIIDLEEAFDIEINEHDAEQFYVVGDIHSFCIARRP